MAALNSFSPERSNAADAAQQTQSLQERVRDALDARDVQGLRRSLHARAANAGDTFTIANADLGATADADANSHAASSVIASANWRDLASNDYLRLSAHPAVVEAAVQALHKWGVSSSASPLISGYTEAHRELEQRLQRWCDFPHALIWNTGYAANQAVLSTLPQRGDIVLADRLIHNSMITGLTRSGARLQRYRHCDTEHLAELLAQHCGEKNRTVFVVTESVFSMDGDYPDLARIAELKARYGFLLVVDEAHALGWYGTRGSGLIEQSGIGAAVDIVVGTLGKGLGAMGAYTLFRDAALRDYLINFAGEFIYSTYLPPCHASSAVAAIDVAEAMGAAGRGHLHALSRNVRAALPNAPVGDSPIVPQPIGSTQATIIAAQRLRASGFSVGAVRPPTVPEGGSRLRLSLHAGLQPEHIAALAANIKEALA